MRTPPVFALTLTSLLAVLLLVAACGGDDDSDAAPDAASLFEGTWYQTLTSEDLPAGIPLELSMSLPGDYEVTYDSDQGSSTLKDGEGNTLVTISAVFEEDTVTFTDDGELCRDAVSGEPEVGTYRWRLEDDQLVYEVIKDPCVARSWATTGAPWTREPAS